jgi:hypothetical protein
MKHQSIPLFFLAVAACAGAPAVSPEQHPDVAAEAAWQQAGLPDVSICSVPDVRTVDVLPCQPHAIAVDDQAQIVYARACSVDGSIYRLPSATEVDVAHEHMHGWSECMFGDADLTHENVDVWGTAMQIVIDGL